MGPATIAILALIILSSIQSFRDESITDKLLFDIKLILEDKQYYRLLTSGFIHADLPHLAFNLISFYSFAGLIEQKCGPKVLIALFLISVIGGNLLSLFLYRKNTLYRALGASGGVCGVIFSAIFLFPSVKIIIFLLPIPMPGWLFAVLFVCFSGYNVNNQHGKVGHAAHLGGALLGLILTFTLYPVALFANVLLALTITIFSIISLLFYRNKL